MGSFEYEVSCVLPVQIAGRMYVHERAGAAGANNTKQTNQQTNHSTAAGVRMHEPLAIISQNRRAGGRLVIRRVRGKHRTNEQLARIPA